MAKQADNAHSTTGGASGHSAEADQPRRRRSRANPGEGGRLRVEILKAAERLLVTGGSEDAITLRKVAAHVGITTPSVYMHFADKQALVGAVAEQVWYGLRDRMADALRSDDDPFRALRRLGGTYIEFASQHPVQYRVLLMRNAAPQPDSAERRAAETVFQYIVDATRPCVAGGVILGDPEYLALRMWCALHGAAALMISHPELPWPSDLDELADDVARMAGLGVAITSRLERAPRPMPVLVAAFNQLPQLLKQIQRQRDA